MKNQNNASEKGKTMMERIAIAIISVMTGVFIINVFVFLIPINNEKLYLESFLAEKYNFSEAECVEWETNSLQKCLNDRNMYFDSYSHVKSCYSKYTTAGNIPRTKESFALINACLLYCHTKQVQDGEECETVEKKELIPQQTNEKCISCTTSSYGVLICILTECIEYDSTKYNDICTPKFKNEMYGCQNGDDVRRVRELIR